MLKLLDRGPNDGKNQTTTTYVDCMTKALNCCVFFQLAAIEHDQSSAKSLPIIVIETIH